MILCLYGDNAYALRQEVERIKDHYRERSSGDLNLETIDMSEHPLGYLLDALAVQPLLATSRFIIVKNMASNKLASAKLDEVLKMVPISTVLLIEEPDIDKRSSYYKKLTQLKGAKEFKKLSDIQLRDWLITEARKIKGSIAPGVALGLVKRVGADQWRLSQELRKLVNYAPTITTESIEMLVSPSTEQTIFTLTDAVVQGNLEKSLNTYQALTRQGIADQQILSMLVWQYRTLVLTNDNIGKNESWTKDFGISSYSVSQASRVASRVTLADLKRAYELIIEADYSIKTGHQESGAALESLLIALCKKQG